MAVLLAAAPESLATRTQGARPQSVQVSPGSDTLRASGGIPADVAGMFEVPVAFQQTPSGTYLVFDRRAQSVFAIAPNRRDVRKLVAIGPESGRIIEPTTLDVGPDGIFVVADAPNRVERIQFFNEQGERVGGFSFPGRASYRVYLGMRALSGVGSLRFTGRSLLVNQPETGWLVTEYGLSGTPVRSFGALRPTGQEDDRDVHLALNVGLPLANPAGGFYFVFLAGEPRFRKYAGDGTLEFERLMQGRELDTLVKTLPARWPRRRVAGEELPMVPPTIRTAAVDAAGRLWVSFIVPRTHVYDQDGERVRKVQFEAAGTLAPDSMFFTRSGRLLVTPGLYEFDPR